jgi:hypothetical protein
MLGAALALAILFVFSPLIKADFVNIDDDLFIQSNVHIQKGITLEGLKWAFQADLFFDSPNADYWQPLVILSRMIDIELWGMNPHGHHLTNILFHAVNSVLLFFILLRFSGQRKAAFFAACFFAFHPIQTEAVAWVTARKDLLATFFIFWALYAYSAWTSSKKKSVYGIAVTVYAFALVCKPSFMMFPVFLFLWDRWPLKRGFSWRDKISFFACSVFYAGFALFRSRLFMNNFEACSVWTGAQYLSYLEKIFWPQDLWVYMNIDQPKPLLHWLGPVFILASLGIAFYFRKKAPWVLPGLAWFFLAFVPAVTLPPACRFAYMPLAGTAVIVGWSLERVFSRIPVRRAVLWILLLFVGLASLSFKETAYWRNAEALFTRCLALNPKDTAAWNNVGVFYLEHRDFEKAFRCFERTIQIQPGNSDAMNNIATLYIRKGDLIKATDVLREIFNNHTASAVTYNNMGFVLLRAGLVAESLLQRQGPIQ